MQKRESPRVTHFATGASSGSKAALREVPCQALASSPTCLRSSRPSCRARLAFAFVRWRLPDHSASPQRRTRRPAAPGDHSRFPLELADVSVLVEGYALTMSAANGFVSSERSRLTLGPAGSLCSRSGRMGPSELCGAPRPVSVKTTFKKPVVGIVVASSENQDVVHLKPVRAQ